MKGPLRMAGLSLSVRNPRPMRKALRHTGLVSRYSATGIDAGMDWMTAIGGRPRFAPLFPMSRN
jgi:hypothetical protein